MKISATISYPEGTTPDQVYELSIDPAFRAEVCRATRALDHAVDIDVHDDATSTVVVTRTMPADLPDFIKKMVGETVGVVQTEQWGEPDDRGQRTADLTVQITGQPATMKGTASIVATEDAAEMRILGELKVAIPFFGKKVEPEIAKGIYGAAAAEQRTAAGHLP